MRALESRPLGPVDNMFARSLIVFIALLQSALPVSAASSLPQTVRLQYATLSDPHSLKPLATINYDPTKYTTEVQSWTPPQTPEAPSGPETNLPLVKVITDSGSSTLTSIGNFNETILADDGRHILVKLSLDPTGKVYNAYVTAGITSSGLKRPAKVATNGKKKSKARLEREAREAARDAKLAEKAKLRSAKKSGATPSAAAPATTSVTKIDTSVNADVQVQLIPSLPGPAPKLAPARQPRVAPDGSQVPVGTPGGEDEEKQEKTFLQKYWWILLIVTVLAMGGGGDGK